MLGAVAGDVIGSVFERFPIKTTEFPLFTRLSTFTDDTVLTVAVADAILNDREYAETLKIYGRSYPDAGYGMAFYQWVHSPRSEPYNSWGNGSAMRVSPVGFSFDSAEDVLYEAEKSAAVTHNHPEGVKGAQATALAVYLAWIGEAKSVIRDEIESRFGYDLDRKLDEIRPGYRFDVSCQGSVPEAIIAFLESESYEDAVRKGISLGGDSDTIACIAGGIAQAFYREIPSGIVDETRHRLPDAFLMIIDEFYSRYGL
jgi:ADP-ribosylglycohydrolase